jgi:hypothetical protein
MSKDGAVARIQQGHGRLLSVLSARKGVLVSDGAGSPHSEKVMWLAIIVAVIGTCFAGFLELLQTLYDLDLKIVLRIAAIPAIGILLFLLVYFIGRRLETAKAERNEMHRVAKDPGNAVRIELELDLRERHRYADGLYYMVIFWLLGIAAFLLLNGFWSASHGDKAFLSDTVILALIGGTTASVLGLFTIVANYLFPSAKSSGGLFEIVANHLFPPAASKDPAKPPKSTDKLMV